MNTIARFDCSYYAFSNVTLTDLLFELEKVLQIIENFLIQSPRMLFIIAFQAYDVLSCLCLTGSQRSKLPSLFSWCAYQKDTQALFVLGRILSNSCRSSRHHNGKNPWGDFLGAREIVKLLMRRELSLEPSSAILVVMSFNFELLFSRFLLTFFPIGSGEGWGFPAEEASVRASKENAQKQQHSWMLITLGDVAVMLVFLPMPRGWQSLASHVPFTFTLNHICHIRWAVFVGGY